MAIADSWRWCSIEWHKPSRSNRERERKKEEKSWHNQNGIYVFRGCTTTQNECTLHFLKITASFAVHRRHQRRPRWQNDMFVCSSFLFVYDVSVGQFILLVLRRNKTFRGAPIYCLLIQPISWAAIIIMSRSTIQYCISSNIVHALWLLLLSVRCGSDVRPHIHWSTRRASRHWAGEHAAQKLINNKSANWMRSQALAHNREHANRAKSHTNRTPNCECEFMNRNLFPIHRCPASRRSPTAKKATKAEKWNDTKRCQTNGMFTGHKKKKKKRSQSRKGFICMLGNNLHIGRALTYRRFQIACICTGICANSAETHANTDTPFSLSSKFIATRVVS